MIIPKIELLSVIVPTRGRSHKLLQLLNALEALSTKTSCAFEVILVIDGDGDIPELNTSYPFQFIKSPHIGAGPARNLGIQASAGDAILFLNDDVVPQPGFLDAHVDALDLGNDAVLGDSPWIEQYKESVSDAATAFDGFIKYTPAIFNQYGLKENQKYDFRHGWTLNLSIRKSAIDQLETHFDPMLRPIYFEDIEFVYRCFGRLDQIIYCPAARATHDHRVTLTEYFSREVLLGMMSVVLHDQNPECFHLLFPCPPKEHARITSETMSLDSRDHSRILSRFMKLADTPMDMNNPTDQALMLFDIHLPIKRRAFRIGLSAMLDQNIHWTKRVPRSTELIKSDQVLQKLVSGT